MTHRWTVALIVTLAGVLAPSLARAQDVVFERDVLPIFAGRCLNCHGGVTKKADLDLRSRESFPPIVSATAAKWIPRFSPEVPCPVRRSTTVTESVR